MEFICAQVVQGQQLTHKHSIGLVASMLRKCHVLQPAVKITATTTQTGSL